MLCECISVGVWVHTEHINERCRLSRGNAADRRMTHVLLTQLNRKRWCTVNALVSLDARWSKTRPSLDKTWIFQIRTESTHSSFFSLLKSTANDGNTPPTTRFLHLPLLSFSFVIFSPHQPGINMAHMSVLSLCVKPVPSLGLTAGGRQGESVMEEGDPRREV